MSVHDERNAIARVLGAKEIELMLLRSELQDRRRINDMKKLIKQKAAEIDSIKRELKKQ